MGHRTSSQGIYSLFEIIKMSSTAEIAEIQAKQAEEKVIAGSQIGVKYTDKGVRHEKGKLNNFGHLTRDPNSGKKSIAKAKRKRIFFRKKLRSESEANVKLFSAKRSEFCEKCENLNENFAHKNC